MKVKLPTDLDPMAGVVRPDQVMTPAPQPMPTLGDFGVRVRSSGASATTAASGNKRGK